MYVDRSELVDTLQGSTSELRGLSLKRGHHLIGLSRQSTRRRETAQFRATYNSTTEHYREVQCPSLSVIHSFRNSDLCSRAKTHQTHRVVGRMVLYLTLAVLCEMFVPGRTVLETRKRSGQNHHGWNRLLLPISTSMLYNSYGSLFVP